MQREASVRRARTARGLTMLVLVLCAARRRCRPSSPRDGPRACSLHRWRLAALIWGALAVQVVATRGDACHAGLRRRFTSSRTWRRLASSVAESARRRGVGRRRQGRSTNGVTIALNGGMLPASQAAVDVRGHRRDLEFANSAVLEHPVLPWLGDVFAWPAPLPLANTFSVGDVLIVVGRVRRGVDR